MTLTDTGRELVVGVDSEIGALCEVIVHRPGLELERLAPGNIADLLFDDVLWASRARGEHDAFAEALRENDVTVHLFGDLLAEALSTPDGRAFALNRTLTGFPIYYGDDDADHTPATLEGGDIHVIAPLGAAERDAVAEEPTESVDMTVITEHLCMEPRHGSADRPVLGDELPTTVAADPFIERRSAGCNMSPAPGTSTRSTPTCPSPFAT